MIMASAPSVAMSATRRTPPCRRIKWSICLPSPPLLTTLDRSVASAGIDSDRANSRGPCLWPIPQDHASVPPIGPPCSQGTIGVWSASWTYDTMSYTIAIDRLKARTTRPWRRGHRLQKEHALRRTSTLIAMLVAMAVLFTAAPVAARSKIALGTSGPQGPEPGRRRSSTRNATASYPAMWSLWSTWGTRGSDRICDVGEPCAFPTDMVNQLMDDGITPVIWWQYSAANGYPSFVALQLQEPAQASTTRTSVSGRRHPRPPPSAR